MHYDIGDELIIKVSRNFGYVDVVYDEVKVQVIGYNVNTYSDIVEYLCYVPQYSHINDSFKISMPLVKMMGLNNKFLGEQAIYVTNRTLVAKRIPRRQGEVCDNCKEFVDYAQRPMGEITYTCRRCKLNPWV